MSSDPAADQLLKRLGPGRLVLVVGASGSGKDTLISAATEHFGHDTCLIFARRAITRAPEQSEQHVAVDSKLFCELEEAGAFALSWQAHGLSYGILASICCEISRGRTVVANVSRSVIAIAKARFSNVTVVLVDCPQHIRERRVIGRGRENAAGVASRLQRVVDGFDTRLADIVIDNSGSVDEGAKQMIAAIRKIRATGTGDPRVRSAS